MEVPVSSNEFSFSNNMRTPWYTTSSEDMTLPTASDEFGRPSDWNEWMHWDPASSQNAEAKPPVNAQGPVCYFKPGQQRPPIYDRRQNSQMRETSLELQTGNTPPRPHPGRINSTPFTFGENIQNPPAFHFDNGTMASPTTNANPQNNGFYSPPVWDQQQGNDNAVFSPVRFEQQPLSSASIAPLSTPSLHHSPNSSNNNRASSSSSSSPEPGRPVNPKKRKSSSEEDDDKFSETKRDKQPPVKKTAHNMIEKRYRTNLNDKIAALRDSVPSLRVMSRTNGNGEEDDDPEDLEGLTPAHKLNKATVLSKATEYIRHLEKRNKRLQEEVTTLKGRLESYEKMAISGPMAMAGAMGTPDGSRYPEDPFASSSMVPPPVSGPPQGMIPVPESMANLHRGLPPQPHYAPQNYQGYTTTSGRPAMSGPPLVNGRRSNGMMGKLMVGSLAGLMMLEGLVEREQSGEEPDGRGLLAFPFNFARFLSPTISMGAASSQVPLAKILLIFGAFFFLISPLLDPKPKSKKKSIPTITLTSAPSLASPVEVRRTAWLTAIQTVWVPQHNFLLELAALALKTLKLSTRKIIGWQGYAFLTGITQDQEAARVKAWNIALDAQLTGGDAEISKSRLVLTLLASGTLPDTPARLMLKALHIRILLWEVAKAGFGNWYMFNELSTKLARRYWKAARNEQRIAASTGSKPDSKTEALPDHLAALIEMECEDVLVDGIIQRAYNLAWNIACTENTKIDQAMDSVVEDHAISSPLDALAAWWSCLSLNKALAGHLISKNSTLKPAVVNNLSLAVRAAPPTSQAQLRALVAKAVLLDEDRDTNIAVALQALPEPAPASTAQDARKSPRTILMNVVGDAPVADDVRNALTLAKCLSLVQSSNYEARRRATFVLNNMYLPETSTTLLSFVAGYKVLNYFMHDQRLQTESGQGLERLASSLRKWMGPEAGRGVGLSNKVITRIVLHCVWCVQTLVGMVEAEDVDAGYVSQTDVEK